MTTFDAPGEKIFQKQYGKRRKMLVTSNIYQNMKENSVFLTLSQRSDFRLFQTDRICRLDENGRKISKQVENTVGKGEIARHEQFLLFPQNFQKTVLQTLKKQVLFGKGLSNM